MTQPTVLWAGGYPVSGRGALARGAPGLVFSALCNRNGRREPPCTRENARAISRGEPDGTRRQCPTTSPLLNLASAGIPAHTSSPVSGARGSTTGPSPSRPAGFGLRPCLRAGLDPPPADPPRRRHQSGQAPPVCPRPAEGLSRMPPAVFVRPPPGRTCPDRQGRAKPLLPGNRSRFLKRVDALLSDEPANSVPAQSAAPSGARSASSSRSPTPSRRSTAGANAPTSAPRRRRSMSALPQIVLQNSLLRCEREIIESK